MDSKAIGMKVRALRTKKGLTTVTLAKKLRLSQAQVSRLENGLQGWRSATLLKFARALDVEPVYFMIEGDEVDRADVHEELAGLGLTPSDRLTKALKDPGFLKFVEKAAKAMRAHKKNLLRMEKALRGVI